MTPDALRRHVLAALFAEPRLQDRLVLKGGNAIELVHGIAARASIDLDFSIAGDFEDPQQIGRIILDALTARLGPLGLAIFDYEFEEVPPPIRDDETPWWGGYRATFKLIGARDSERLSGDLMAMQREAMPTDHRQGRTFRLDISKHEYFENRATSDVEGVRVYAYTEETLVIEKLRAICQQHPDYHPTSGRQNAARRARDFFDVHTVVTNRALDLLLPENVELLRRVFAAKAVPLELLSRIEETREFHRPDWDAVVEVVPGRLNDYDFYFDRVKALATAVSAQLA